MIVDLSKIPSTCKFTLLTSNYKEFNYYCSLEEQIKGRVISSFGRGVTPQEAVDAAIEKFLN